MLMIRNFLKTLIGSVTPFQVLLACVLGALLGFLPITNGGTIAALVLVLLLLVLNANLFLAGIVATGVKLVSIATAPLAFAIGRLLIDGPTRPIAAALANGPVTAWLGFDSSLSVGGLVLGLVIGVVLGLVVSKIVLRLRSAIAGLEEGSDAFRALMQRRTIRWAAWVLFGGIPKGGFASSAARRGLPIRISGVVISTLLIVLVVIGGWLLAGGAAKRVLVRELTRLNGSTVDIEALDIAWFGGRAEIVGLQISNPEALDRNLFEAERLAADLDLDSFLRRRFAIDDVVVSSARLESDRTTPAIRHESSSKAPTIEDESPSEIDGVPLPEGNLEEYLQTAREWKERLQQIQGVLEKIADRIPPASVPEADSPSSDSDDSLEAWLREQVDLHGYAGVRATHLIEGTPTVLVRKIEADGIRTRDQSAPTYDLVITSMSTEPGLVESPPAIEVRSSDESLTAELELGRISKSGGQNRFDITLRDLPAERIVEQLVKSQNPPFSGGSIDAAMTGTFTLRPTISLVGPLEVVLRNCTIRIANESATIAELPVRLDVGGRLDDPAVALDEKAFADALEKAGAGALAARARNEAQSQVDRGLQNLENKTGIEIPDDVRKGIGEVIGGGLDGLLGGNRDKD
ncbi:MAG: hypothetical protein CMJ67_00705 [Planctomycetaceae bacterium]|nr:hypothetical protein [Planctomycetaceae bacterium]